MKTMDNTKKAILAIGIMAIIAGVIGLINSSSLMEQFFPLYIGFTLMGASLLHKEENPIKSL